jgi:hypothetical protein
MSGLEWFLSTVLVVLYVALIFTVAILTFRKGHVVLGVAGIFLPILWLVGAVLPPTARSRYDVESYQREQALAATSRGGAL